MTTYIKYQCTVCRREKTLEQDTIRAALNQCTITKGCGGLLQSLGPTALSEPTEPVSGVEDWYPRGQIASTNTASVKEMVGLAMSSSGAIAIAVNEQNEGSLPSTLEVTFEQRRAESVKFNEYAYRLTSATTVFTGKDSNGKILRIDSDAIADERIQVRVNGVLTTAFTPTINTITLTSAAIGLVTIRVQTEKETITRVLTFERNTTVSAARGSWGNIDLIRRFKPDVGYETWWAYSIDSISGLGVGKLKLVSVGNGSRESMVVLAHTPFSSFDRYLNFVVPATSLMTNDFPLSIEAATRSVLQVDRTIVAEIYPPLRLQADAFVVPEEPITESSSAIVTDDVNVLLSGSKILGPV